MFSTTWGFGPSSSAWMNSGKCNRIKVHKFWWTCRSRKRDREKKEPVDECRGFEGKRRLAKEWEGLREKTKHWQRYRVVDRPHCSSESRLSLHFSTAAESQLFRTWSTFRWNSLPFSHLISLHSFLLLLSIWLPKYNQLDQTPHYCRNYIYVINNEQFQIINVIK